MMDPERHVGTFGREYQRYQGTDDRRASRGDADAATSLQASSIQSERARIRRAGERLLLLAEADGAVSEGGVPSP